MKRVALAMLLAGIGIHAAAAQPAYRAGGANVCIKSYLIDRTKSPDDRTIIFYMKDQSAWQTTLRGNCPELRFNGFIYASTPPDDICGNLQSIRVLRTGSVCLMGPLVPYAPRPQGS